MQYRVADIIEDVRIAIDQNSDSSALSSIMDTDTLELEQIIRSKVEPAARLVHEEAAHSLLDKGKALTDPVVWQSEPGYGAGSIELPDDFLRLVTFKMSDWDMAVTSPITDEHPSYAMQKSRYAGIRGNVQRPVVAIVHGALHDVLEFYSCSAGPGVRVSRACYIAVPKIDNADYIGLCPKLRDAVVYRAASMTAQSTGNIELAAMLLASSNDLSGIVTQQPQQQPQQ